LQKNISANGYRNVVAVNAALSERAGKLKLYLCDENRGDHRIYAAETTRPAIEVAALVADDFLSDPCLQVRFVKVDVQGAEAKVLRGMRKLLRRSSACQIALEFWPLGLHRAGDDAAEMIQSLVGLGFDFELVNESERRLASVEPYVLVRQFTVGVGNQTNLLLTKRPQIMNRDGTVCLS
jgi:FkbM family methyltransferase